MVIKGKASIVTDNREKAFAMNAMMQKYQGEGGYTPLTEGMKSIQHLTVLKINPETMTGKYKIGQEWTAKYRSNIARKIIEREGMARAKEILGANENKNTGRWGAGDNGSGGNVTKKLLPTPLPLNHVIAHK